MSKRPTDPVLIEFVRVDYDKETGAIITELVVPDINTIDNLSRIELLIYNDANEATTGVMLNYGDRLDPIPPGNFGVIINPASDDRSIKNVSSAAGVPGRFDHISPHSTLLKQSVSGIVNGNLGISIWIAPQDWAYGHYTIKTRAIQWKRLPAPWQKQAEFTYSDKGVDKITQNACLVKPIFFNSSDQTVMPFDKVHFVTLIIFEKQPQDEGITIKRWAGDTGSRYKFIEKEKRKLKLGDLRGEFIHLEPGFYQFKHNSVSGHPPSGFYGESNLFEIKAENELIDVRIPLYPAI